jgi:prepilin peptidase CpaA
MLSLIWLVYAAISVACGISDLLTYRIPNLFVILLIAGFAGTALQHRNSVDWVSHLGSFVVILGVCATFYALGKMGAGDVKLLAALALWSGAYGLIPLLFWVSLCGLIAMGAIVLARHFVPLLQVAALRTRPLPRLLTKGEVIPFGLGIGAGAIIASFSFPAWLWQS